jgi:hypothetical protein
MSFSSLNGYVDTLLNGAGITSVTLDETTGNINLPSWLTERFAATRVAPGGGSFIGGGGSGLNNLNYFIYFCWNQGSFGAQVHYEIIKGRRELYPTDSMPPDNIILNWYGRLTGCSNPKYTASDGTTACDVQSLYNKSKESNQKLANAFIEVGERVFREEKEVGAQAWLAAPPPKPTNRSGVPYQWIKDAINRVANEEKHPFVTADVLATFAYIENSFETDTPTGASFKTMFQMGNYNTNGGTYKGRQYPSYVGIFQKYDRGPSKYNPAYTNYASNSPEDMYNFIKDVFPHIVNGFDSFQTKTNWPN